MSTSGGTKFGYLEKLSGDTNWNSRFFILGSNSLAYYTNSKATGSPNGVFYLVPECSVEAIPGHRNSFQLLTPARTVFLRGQSEIECDEWMNAIEESIGALQENAQISTMSLESSSEGSMLDVLEAARQLHESDEIYEIIYPNKRVLGIGLVRVEQWAVVNTSKAPKVTVGSILTAVNGENVILKSYREVVWLLKNCNWPLTLLFRRAPSRTGHLSRHGSIRECGLSQWKTYNFVLSEGLLRWFDLEHGTVKGSLALKGVHVSPVTVREHQYCLMLQSGPSTLLLEASTGSVWVGWTAALYHAAALASGGRHVLATEERRQLQAQLASEGDMKAMQLAERIKANADKHAACVVATGIVDSGESESEQRDSPMMDRVHIPTTVAIDGRTRPQRCGVAKQRVWEVNSRYCKIVTVGVEGSGDAPRKTPCASVNLELNQVKEAGCGARQQPSHRSSVVSRLAAIDSGGVGGHLRRQSYAKAALALITSSSSSMPSASQSTPVLGRTSLSDLGFSTTPKRKSIVPYRAIVSRVEEGSDNESEGCESDDVSPDLTLGTLNLGGQVSVVSDYVDLRHVSTTHASSEDVYARRTSPKVVVRGSTTEAVVRDLRPAAKTFGGGDGNDSHATNWTAEEKAKHRALLMSAFLALTGDVARTASVAKFTHSLRQQGNLYQMLQLYNRMDSEGNGFMSCQDFLSYFDANRSEYRAWDWWLRDLAAIGERMLEESNRVEDKDEIQDL